MTNLPDAKNREDAVTVKRTYKILRFYRDGTPVWLVKRGLTLAQAQEHCRREDTHGPGWFDGYEEEK